MKAKMKPLLHLPFSSSWHSNTEEGFLDHAAHHMGWALAGGTGGDLCVSLRLVCIMYLQHIYKHSLILAAGCQTTQAFGWTSHHILHRHSSKWFWTTEVIKCFPTAHCPGPPLRNSTLLSSFCMHNFQELSEAIRSCLKLREGDIK